MFKAELCLQRAIRSALLDHFMFDQTYPVDVEIQMDNQVPAIAKTWFVAIVGAGCTPGPLNTPSGGVLDTYFAVKLTLYHRLGQVARDRRPGEFSEPFGTFSKFLDAMISVVHFDYGILHTAKASLDADPDALFGTGEFPEPFRDWSVDPSPRAVYREDYDAAQLNVQTGDPMIAIARSIVFRRARFIRKKT